VREGAVGRHTFLELDQEAKGLLLRGSCRLTGRLLRSVREREVEVWRGSVVRWGRKEREGGGKTFGEDLVERVGALVEGVLGEDLLLDLSRLSAALEAQGAADQLLHFWRSVGGRLEEKGGT
jgi:hypothetical protein